MGDVFMKNIINYYYQMNIENIHLSNGIYYFTYKNNNYMFIPFNNDYILLNYLYILNQLVLQKSIYYHEIMLNKDRLPYLFVDGKCYCLLRESNLINYTISFYDLSLEKIEFNSKLTRLIRFPWSDLWSNKLDYLENILTHLELSYKNVLPICLYFMGLAENAIEYVNEILENERLKKEDELVISHTRIDINESIKELYSPLNLIVDHPSRDISEYLKSLFAHNDYDYNEIEEYIMSLNFSDVGLKLLYGRMLYPSFFFDLWDEVIADKKIYNDLLIYENRLEEYRIFLKEIYYIIKKRTYLEEVRWILRE